MNELLQAVKAVIDCWHEQTRGMDIRMRNLRDAVERVEDIPVAWIAKHVHADLIHAWAEGAEIQWQEEDGTWHDLENPTWGASCVYRIKPRQPVRLSDEEIDKVCAVWRCRGVHLNELVRDMETAFIEKNQ